MSVIDFPKAEDDTLCLACECGCTTFRILSCGSIECPYCERVMDDDVTSVNYEDVKRAADGASLKDKVSCGTTDLALRRVISRISEDETAAVVVINLNGQTSVWSIGADDDEARKWFMDRVNDLPDMLLK